MLAMLAAHRLAQWQGGCRLCSDDVSGVVQTHGARFSDGQRRMKVHPDLGWPVFALCHSRVVDSVNGSIEAQRIFLRTKKCRAQATPRVSVRSP